MKTCFHPAHLLALLLTGLLVGASPTRSHAQAGSLDPGFNPDAGANGPITSIVVQGDGRILLAGKFTTVNEVKRNGIARLLADGSLDTSFDPGTGASGGNYGIYAMAVQADGKVVVTGDFTSLDGIARAHVARLNADGSLDGTFAQGLTLDYDFNVLESAVTVQPDGKVFIVGHFFKVNGVARHSTARLNSDGSLDPTFVPSFPPPDFGAERYATALAVQPDGKVVIGGYIPDGKGRLRISLDRLNADGGLDPSFHEGGGGGGFGSTISALALQPDGKIVLTGDFGGVATRRIKADGSVDGSFRPFNVDIPVFNSGHATVSSLALQANGNLVIGGNFNQVEGVPRNGGVARLNSDGNPDPGFSPVAGYNSVSAIALQSDGKIVVAVGAFTDSNGQASDNHIVRLNGGPSPATPSFFSGNVEVGRVQFYQTIVYYLPTFGYYQFLFQHPGIVYHNDLGALYLVEANDGKGGIYFYDFATPRGARSLGFFFTSPSLFPYLYSFGLNTFVYYLPEPELGTGFYTATPRVFIRLDTGEILYR